MTIPLQTHPLSSTTGEPTRHTLRFQRAYAPLVVDMWEPAEINHDYPILLVHGWGGTGSYWESTARALAKSAQVIVPDLPGTGRSQPIKSTRDMYQQVDTLAYLLDELELERLQIIGHSMGGAMSVLLSADYPERVERLILTSLTFFMTQQQKDIYETVMSGFRLAMRFRPGWLVDVPGVPQMMATQYFHRVPDDQNILRQGLRDYLNLHRGTALACANNATDSTITEAGANVQAPTLLIAARQDKMMPLENVDFTINTIPQCNVRWIERCGHFPMIEKPNDYLAIVREFLDLT